MLRTGADEWSSQTGGSTWNVARVMARLGVPSAFAGAISLDVFGDAQATDAAGLDLRFLQRRAKSPLLAIVHELHPPTYFFIGDDSADLHFDAAQLPAGWMRGRNGCISAASAWRANRWRASWWRWRRNSRRPA
jgi:fructokinase